MREPAAAAFTKMPAMYPEGNETELDRTEMEKEVFNEFAYTGLI